jgi:hypothetical protein
MSQNSSSNARKNYIFLQNVGNSIASSVNPSPISPGNPSAHPSPFPDKAAIARQNALAREARRQKAMHVLGMHELLVSLGLCRGDALLCPFCGVAGVVECGNGELPQMQCRACRSKDNVMQVVKAARKIKE